MKSGNDRIFTSWLLHTLNVSPSGQILGFSLLSQSQMQPNFLINFATQNSGQLCCNELHFFCCITWKIHQLHYSDFILIILNVRTGITGFSVKVPLMAATGFLYDAGFRSRDCCLQPCMNLRQQSLTRREL